MRTPHERLQAFLYILARDHMPAKKVVGLVTEAAHWVGPAGLPHVESLASDLADRLIGREEPEPEYRFGVFTEDGILTSSTYCSTTEIAKLEIPDWGHVRRGRMFKEKSVAVSKRIEWEDEPYGQ